MFIKRLVSNIRVRSASSLCQKTNPFKCGPSDTVTKEMSQIKVADAANALTARHSENSLRHIGSAQEVGISPIWRIRRVCSTYANIPGFSAFYSSREIL